MKSMAGFYERMGYERKYAIEGRPKGYADIIYVKVFGCHRRPWSRERRESG
jgi:hypothetical protein